MGKSKTPMTKEAAQRMQSSFDKQIAEGKDTTGSIQQAKSRVMSTASKKENKES